MNLDDFLPIALIVLVIITAMALFIIKSEGTKCMANPLEYGVDKLGQQTNPSLMCICSYTNSSFYKSFIVESNMTYPIKDNTPTVKPDKINLTI